DSNHTEGHQGGDGMCEQVLNTGNIPVKGGITQGTVNTFNFIFDVRPAGKSATKAGQGQIRTVREGNGHGNKDINPEAVNVR
ncbi:hypothetical protein, partial [Enterobacter cloacae]